jgi:hypothetical protein
MRQISFLAIAKGTAIRAVRKNSNLRGIECWIKQPMTF